MRSRSAFSAGLVVTTCVAVVLAGVVVPAAAQPVTVPATAHGRVTAGVPSVSETYSYRTRTTLTTRGSSDLGGVATSATRSTPNASSDATGLFEGPQPVTSLASLTGTDGGVVSIASGEFSTSGHEDVAAVICNPCASWANTPYLPEAQGQYSIAILPGLGDGTFGTPTQLSPVGANVALDMIVAADLGNGHDDLVVSEDDPGATHPYQLLIFLGNGDGTFQTTPISVVAPGPIARFEVANLGDGHPDIVAAVTGGADGNEVVVFTGDGTGNFTADAPMPLCPGAPSGCPTSDAITDLVVAPLVKGGAPDILVSQYTGYIANSGYQSSTDTLAVMMNNGSGTFAAPSYPVTDMNATTGIEVGDFAGTSGEPDALLVGSCILAAAGNSPSHNCQLQLYGNGDGTFQPPNANNTTVVESGTTRAAVSDAPVDLTGDDTADALWLSTYANNQSPVVEAMVNNGDGTFTRQELVGVLPGDVYASTALPVDLTGSGQPDLVVGGGPIGSLSSSPGLWVVPADPSAPGRFVTAQGYEPNPVEVDTVSLGPTTQYDQSVAVGDFDGHGDDDIVSVAANGDNSTEVTVLPGNGDGTFGAPVTTGYTTAASSVFPRWGLVSGDFTGSGNLDIAYLDNNGGLDYQLGNGDGTFGPVIQVPGSATVGGGHSAADLVLTTLNGEPDVIASVLVGSTQQYLESWLWDPTSSTFAAPVVSGPLPALSYGDADIAIGHFSAGDPVDIATVVQPSGGVPEVDVISGNADGSFNTASPTQVATPCSTATGGSNNYSYGAIAVGDVGNGHDDVVWQCIDSLYVALGNGDGTFQSPAAYGEATVGNNAHLMLADLEGNGELDAIAWGGDGGYSGMQVWHNNGDGTFASAQDISMGLPMSTAAGEGLTAAALTTAGTDDLIAFGSPPAQATDEMTVFLSTGGRPALETTEVSAPTPSVPAPGNMVTGSYEVRDTGAAVSNSWMDSVYLVPGTSGTTWTSADTLLERIPQTQSLSGGGSYTGQYTFPLGDTPAGSYHLIVVPDSGDVLSGGNETTGASPAFTVGPVPTLTVGAPVDTDVQAGQTLYYQVDVSAGPDVQVDVTGLPAGTDVSLLAENGQVPTPQSAAVGSATADVTLPASSPGTWYVVIAPSLATSAAAVPVTVLASDVGLTLEAVSPATHTIPKPPALAPCTVTVVGNASMNHCPEPPVPPVGDGLMTLTLQGSGFGSDLSVRLVDGSHSYPATTVSRRDSTVAFASFPVASQYPSVLPSNQVPPGVYDLVVSSGGHEVTRTNGFVVAVGPAASPPPTSSPTPLAPLSVTLSAPSSLRQGWVGPLSVELTNNTSTDIAVPVLAITSPNALLGAPGQTDPAQFTGSLEFDDPVLSTDPLTDPSPPGILGAGQSFTFDLSILSNTSVGGAALETDTTVVASSDTTPIDWSTLLASYQPPGMSASDWTTVVASFGIAFGDTVGAFAMSLRTAFQQSQADGVPASNEAAAIGYLVDEELATSDDAPVSGSLYLSSTSQPLGDVPMTLTSTTTSMIYTTTSWYTGQFSFFGVPSGTYELGAVGYLPDSLLTVKVDPIATGLSVIAQPAATLAGTVTELDGVTPVSGAVVTAVDSQGNRVSSAATGATGDYSIGGLAAGPVTVTASAAGFETDDDLTATVALGTTTTLDVMLTEEGAITGTITAPAGGAPTGATVDAELSTSASALSGTVADDGTYTIADLAPGTYTVVAEAPGDGPAEQTSVTVTAGGTTSGVDLALSASPATVSGTVTDADTGAPIAGATVSTDAANGAEGPVTTADDGTFTLSGLPAGAIDVDVTPPDTSHLNASVTVTATAGATTTTTVELDPAGTVSATVDAGDGTTPLAGVAVEVVGPSPGSADDPEGAQQEVTDASGDVSLTGLSSGDYDFQVVGSDTHQPFVIGPNQRDAVLHVSVPTGTVSGQVEDAGGNPVADVPVSLADSTGLVATTQTDGTGAYSFTVTSAGAYDVVAAGTPVGLLVASGISVSLGQTTTVPALQAGTDSLTVSVQSGDNPVDGATVILSPHGPNDQPAAVTASTGSAGTATIDNLAAGTYDLQVADGTDATDLQTVTVASGANSEPIAMAEAGSISGVVTDSTSTDVSGATVVATGARTGLVFSTTTAADGTYSMSDLPADTYAVSVSVSGDAPTDADGVSVTAGGQATANVTLPTTGSTLTVTLAANGDGPLPSLTATLEDATGTPVASEPVGAAVAGTDSTAQATFAPLTPGAYTVLVSGPGTATTSQSVTVGAGTTAATITAPVGEALAPPTTTTQASPAQLVGEDATARTMPALVRAADASSASPGVWQSIQYYMQTWSTLIPAPNLPQTSPYKQPDGSPPETDTPEDQLLALFANIAGHQIGAPCYNPYLTKAQLYAQLAQQALNHWTSDFMLLGDQIWQNKVAIDKQLALTIGGGLALTAAVLALAPVAAALGISSGAASGVASGILAGTTVGGELTVALSAISVGELADSVRDGISNLDANSEISDLNDLDGLLKAAMEKVGQVGGQKAVEAVGKWGGQLTNVINLVTSMISALQAMQSAMQQLKSTVDDAAEAEGNFWNYLSYGNYALAGAYAYTCPPKPVPMPPLPQVNQEFPYDLPQNDHSVDPNAIVGPSGDGSAKHYVTPGTALPYTIDFVNEATATSPATKVVVTTTVPAGTDPSTIRLTGFGFGSTSVAMSGDVTAFSRLVAGLDLTNGDDVSASGSYDPATRTITWTLEAINPATGDVDGSPDAGFLPPDDAAGDGEGYVSFQVDAQSSLATGSRISAHASIVFDANAPLMTNTWVNTIDATAPSATVAPLPAVDATPFPVTWSGSTTTSRVASYNVYVSRDNGPWRLWLQAVTARSARYPAQSGHLYQFAATATDVLGLTGHVPTRAQAFTTAEAAYAPVTPASVTDTTVGARTTSVVVVGGHHGVPSIHVGAVVVEVQASDAAAAGSLTVWAAGTARPATPNLYFTRGADATGVIVTPLGAHGAVDVYNASAGTVHVAAQVSGWFLAAGRVAGALVTLAPPRSLAVGTASAAGDEVASRTATVVAVDGHAGLPKSGVAAVLLELAVPAPAASGAVTVWPSGTTRPRDAQVQVVRGQPGTTVVLAQVGAHGRIDVYNGSSRSLRVDATVLGWFASGSPVAVGGLTPLASAPVQSTRVARDTTDTVVVDGHGDVPTSGVRTVLVEVTVDRPPRAGSLTLWAKGSARPALPDLSFAAGQSVTELVVVAVGAHGAIALSTSATTALTCTVDVVGWTSS